MNSRIFLDVNAVQRLAPFVRRHFPGHRIVIITDTRVQRLHARIIAQSLIAHRLHVRCFAVPPGERSKTREAKSALEDKLIAGRFGRDTLIIAVGGGVVGDLAGFVAATYMRGVPYIQVPTTLVSQTDSAIGGKVGVDSPWGKNLIGAFHAPAAVFIDPTLLCTLPCGEVRQGLVEMVKHGLIAEPSLARAIARRAAILTTPQHPRFVRTLFPLLRRSIRIKRGIVAHDPLETNGQRAVLNYGHTFGHAIEQASRYRVAHGDAVAIGMTRAAEVAVRRGLLSQAAAAEQTRILSAIGAPTALPQGMNPAALLKIMERDKKARNHTPCFVLLKGLGHPIVHIDSKQLRSQRIENRTDLAL
ncbi:MAG: 3-dehydroquinate synthase [Deltaproteobacteria bacterium]|nr:3-dehydroquinate synthase [Deltaproteobacteria bacterium]